MCQSLSDRRSSAQPALSRSTYLDVVPLEDITAAPTDAFLDPKIYELPSRKCKAALGSVLFQFIECNQFGFWPIAIDIGAVWDLSALELNWK